MENKDLKILALLGMAGSGVSTAIEHLTSAGIPKVYFGGILRRAMAAAGVEYTPENERCFREDIRTREGDDFVVKHAIEEINNLIAAGQKRIVLDGLCSWTEYRVLKKAFPTTLITVSLVAPKQLRRQRLATRAKRPLSAKEAAARDYSEIEKLEKGGPIALADYFLDGSVDKDMFYQKLDELLKTIDFFPHD